VTDPLVDLVGRGVRAFDLARPYVTGMPQSPNHPAYTHVLQRRHGDMVRADGSSAANDLIVLGTHVGTHMDALAHVSHAGRLHGGIDASAAQRGGRFGSHGIDTVAPIFGRGVLLDVPATLGAATCDPGYEITPRDLDDTVRRQGIEVRAGDVVLIRSGWGSRWADGPVVYVGHDSGVPGVGEAGARWLAERGVRAAGADSIAFERLAPGAGHALLPAHRVLLVEAGINIIETLDLEMISEAGVHEFVVAAAPLPLVGATGSPLRPLAIVSGRD